MPYVSKAVRKQLQTRAMKRPGELNYCITKLLTEYLEEKGTSYQTMNDVLGALSSAALEFNRRIVAPYEDTKIAQNGDVYHD